MTCAQARRLLPGYLDGALPNDAAGLEHARLSRHLSECAGCREHLESYRQLALLMAGLAPVRPPEDLGVRIRVAVSRAGADRGFSGRMRRLRVRSRLLLENVLEPLALPAAGGVLAAVMTFAMIHHQFVGASASFEPGAADTPTAFLQPARLQTLAGFQMPSLLETGDEQEHSLLLEATVNAAGQAVSYRVISGEMDPLARRELDQVMMFSRFRPQMSFGRPTSGGRVVMSFSKIRVRG